MSITLQFLKRDPAEEVCIQRPWEGAGSPCAQSFLFLIYLFFSLGEQADSVLHGVDAVPNQRQYNEQANYDDEDDKVSCDHDACGLR